MTVVVFKKRADRITGVKISGHSGYAEAGNDIVCAAVTSAVRLCECTINDVIGAKAGVSINEKLAEISILLPNNLADDVDVKCQTVFMGLKLHMQALEEEYPQNITVSEV